MSKRLLILIPLIFLLSGCFRDNLIYEKIMESDWEYSPIYLTAPDNNINYRIDITKYSIPYGFNNRKTTKSEITILEDSNVMITDILEEVTLSPEQLYHAIIEDGIMNLFFEESSYQEDFKGFIYTVTINLHTQEVSYDIQSKEIDKKGNFRKVKYYTYKNNEFKYYRLPHDNSDDFLIELTDNIYTPDDIYDLLSSEIDEDISNFKEISFSIINRWGDASSMNNYLQSQLSLPDNFYNILLKWSHNDIEVVQISKNAKTK